MVKPIRISVLCFLVAALAIAQGARAQTQFFAWAPEDPPNPGNPALGTGVAVSGSVAAIGAPYYEFYSTEDFSQPDWMGLVNVYETDAQRTRWTLLTVLHLDDSTPEHEAFGKAIAMEGRHLVIAANASLHIFERSGGGYELVDTVELGDATISESAPIQFVNDVLAVGVLNNAGHGKVRLFHIGRGGRAWQVAEIPREPDANAGALSLDADARTLAVTISRPNGDFGVNLYEARHKRWFRTSVVRRPSASAAGFGASVALSGNRLVVGAPSEDQEYDLEANGVRWSGAVHVYRRAHHRWVHVQKLATNDLEQPSYGSVQFGREVITNGRDVWITAPYSNEQWASTLQEGPAALYRWNEGRLEYVMDGPSSYPEGAIDMTRRYLIEGDVLNYPALDGAHIVDLNPTAPTDTERELAH